MRSLNLNPTEAELQDMVCCNRETTFGSDKGERQDHGEVYAFLVCPKGVLGLEKGWMTCQGLVDQQNMVFIHLFSLILGEWSW